MRKIAAFLLIALFAPAAFGEDDPRRAQVDAANADAFQTLRHEILAMPISKDFTVATLLDRVNGRAELDSALQCAQQIGGARWLDAHTVQVRLEAAGPDVAAAIEKIAERHRDTLPLSLEKLHERLRADFSQRTFSATGASMAGSSIDQLRPDPSQVSWRVVCDKDRRSAIEAARAGAIDRVLNSLRPAGWDGRHSLGDILQKPPIREALQKWLAARPITSIEFHDDLSVRLTLGVTPGDVWAAVKSVLPDAHHSEGEWRELRHQVEARMASPIGVAVAQAGPPAPGAAAIALPVDPPRWTQASLDGEGIARGVGVPKLKTARAAEAAAGERLRAQLNALPLPTMTLGQAAAKDPRIEEALRRSLRQAHIARVDYDSPERGSVRVHLVLDLKDVWRELAGR